MTKRKNFGDKYAHKILILLGIGFIVIGLISQLNGINSFKFYYAKYDELTEMPYYITYIIGGFLILIFFKKEWIFKKEKKSRRGEKSIKLKRSKLSSDKKDKDNKIKKLDKVSILKVNK